MKRKHAIVVHVTEDEMDAMQQAARVRDGSVEDLLRLAMKYGLDVAEDAERTGEVVVRVYGKPHFLAVGGVDAWFCPSYKEDSVLLTLHDAEGRVVETEGGTRVEIAVPVYVLPALASLMFRVAKKLAESTGSRPK